MLPLKLLKDLPSNLRASITILLVVLLSGTVGFHLLEGAGFVTSLYWTVATITTIGYGDVVPQTPEGRIFSIIIIISGVSVGLYTFTAAMAFSMEGEKRFKKMGADKIVLPEEAGANQMANEAIEYLQI